MELQEYSYTHTNANYEDVSKFNMTTKVYPRIVYKDNENEFKKWFDFDFHIKHEYCFYEININTFIFVRKSHENYDKYIYMTDSTYYLYIGREEFNEKSLITEIVHGIFSIMIYTINSSYNENLKIPPLKCIYEHTICEKEYYSKLSNLFLRFKSDKDSPGCNG